VDRQPGEDRFRTDDVEGGRFRRGHLNRDVALPCVMVVYLHFFFEKFSAAPDVGVDDVNKFIQS
jgi:hypothetical protein